MTSYTIRSYHNEKMNRVGMNAANLIHEQSLEHIATDLRDIATAIEEEDYDDAVSSLDILANMVDDHNRLRRIFLNSYNVTNGLVDSVFELNSELRALAHFEYLNHIDGIFLETVEDYCEDPLYIKANRYEITGVFQNLISNAVEAMKNNPGSESHKLTIKTRRINGTAEIIISDTGKGFPGADRQGRVPPEKIKTSKRSGGFGLVHVRYFVREYKGTLAISNRPEGGASIRITLPVIGGYNINDILKGIVREAFLKAHEAHSFFSPEEEYYHQPLLLRENREKVTNLLHSLVDFAISEIMNCDEPGASSLRVETDRQEGGAVVLITHSCAPFPVPENQKRINLEELTAARQEENLPSQGIREILQEAGGSLVFYNDSHIGPTIRLTLPLSGEAR